MRRVVPLLACLILAVSAGLGAYLELGSQVGSQIVALQWKRFPIRYFVGNRDSSGVTSPALQQAVDRAFATWKAVPGTPITTEFGGFTSNQPFAADNVSVIGFRSRPDLDRTLGATTFNLDLITGEVLEADIFLNTAFNWSVEASGEADRFDVESILLHEIGHVLGLGHSALGETELTAPGRRRVIAKGAVMFPIAFGSGSVTDRHLQPDDQAGLVSIYTAPSGQRALGSVSGRVILNGTGVFGAHVTAFNPSTGAVVGTFTLNQQGEFVTQGLTPGMYVLRAEPLDDADVESFFGAEVVVNINFKPAFAATLVAVPAGGTSDSVSITVTAK
ncbi:MAG: matrixin family metalloprotease [Vicinamibacterales bacterium]